MDSKQIVNQATKRMQAAAEHFAEELKKLRTGRAHPSMLDGVTVSAYGMSMPLIQVGSVTVPEPQLLQVTPFDPANLQAIAAGIRDNQGLGLNPTDDGRVVRIQIPALNEERRREFAKILGAKAEDCMVSLRNTRHDALKGAEAAKKDRQITEDDLSSLKKQFDELMNKFRTQVESQAKAKEQEIMKV